jgi:hypothetical protein
MALTNSEGDLNRWGVLFIAVIVVVAFIVGVMMDKRMMYRKYPKVIHIKHSKLGGEEGFEPSPEFSNYQSKPVMPVQNAPGCNLYLGGPPGYAPFPQGTNPYRQCKNWTVSMWVKMKSLDVTESFPLMRKGTISQNGTPSILYVRKPVNNISGQVESKHNEGCIMFTYRILNNKTKKYFGNNLATMCPSPKPIKAGEWKHLAWVQNDDKMTLYEDGVVVFYNPNAPLDMSPGNLRFSNGDQHIAELRNVMVCEGAKNWVEMQEIYTSTHPKLEGISSQFARSISVHSDLKRKRSVPTATYRGVKEDISGTFYELIEVENYMGGSEASLRGKFAHKQNPMLLSQ